MGRALTERETEVLRSYARRIDPSDAGAHNNLGVLYFRKGLIEEAIEQFHVATELDLKMTVAQRNLEFAYTETGYYDRRVAELRERLRRDPDDRDARWELGRTYTALGQFEAGIAEYSVMLGKHLDDVAAMMQVGLAEKQRGNLDAATDWFRRVVESELDSSIGHFYLGEVLYNRGQHAEALDALTRATKLNPDNAEAQHLIAFLLGDLGRHEEARMATKRAIALNPTFGRAQANLSLERYFGDRKSRPFKIPEQAKADDEGREAVAHFNLGQAFREQGYYTDAVREYRMALDQGEDRRSVLQAMAEVHVLNGDHVAALELYETLVGEEPEIPKLWNERGVVLHQLGRPDEAIASYRAALERRPDYSLALNNLAVTLAQEGKWDAAVSSFYEAITADSSVVTPRLNLGLLLSKSHRPEALQAYRRVLESDPKSAPAWNGLGLVMTELDRPQDARNAFARAVESDPNSAEAHYNLSFVLSTLGEYDAALRSVTRAQTLDPYYVPQKFRLAIDIQLDEAMLSVVPEISADIEAVRVGADFDVDTEALGALFTELTEGAGGSNGAEGGGDVAEATQRRDDDSFALSREYLGKGLLDLAAAEAKRALARGGDSTEANVLAGEIYAKRGLFGEAIERFREARRENPNRVDAFLGEFRAMLALQQGADAIDDAEALAVEHPEDVEVLVTLAQIRLANDSPAAALEVLNLARSRAPQRPDILRLEGDIAVGMGDFDTACRVYLEALQLDPKLIQVHFALGKVYEHREEWDVAENAYRSAVDVLPTYSEAVVALSNLYVRRRHARAAVDLLVDVLAVYPSDGGALSALGRALTEDERFEESLHVFQRLLAFDDANVEAHFFIGVGLARQREYARAVNAWARVLELDSSSDLAERARRHMRSAKDLQQILTTMAS